MQNWISFEKRSVAECSQLTWEIHRIYTVWAVITSKWNSQIIGDTGFQIFMSYKSQSAKLKQKGWKYLPLHVMNTEYMNVFLFLIKLWQTTFCTSVIHIIFIHIKLFNGPIPSQDKGDCPELRCDRSLSGDKWTQGMLAKCSLQYNSYRSVLYNKLKFKQCTDLYIILSWPK